MQCKKGFTFVETLIVIGIIGVLATAVVVATNPAKKFEAARDRQREIHVQTILTAVYQYRATKGEDCPGMPEEIDTVIADEEEKKVAVFKTIGTGEGMPDSDKYYNLYDCLMPFYLDKPLFDPKDGSPEDTKYEIWKNPHTGRVTVRSEVKRDIFAGPEVWILSEPIVETIDPDGEWPEDITHYSARAGGEVTENGGAHVWESGVVWNEKEEGDPKDLWDNYLQIGADIGSFNAVISGLSTDTEYYIRAYAKNDIGTGYGDIKEFKTLDAKPGVSTLSAENVTPDTAEIWGEITELGPLGEDPDLYFGWGQESLPYSDELRPEDYENYVSLGTGGLGKFFHEITSGLITGETYYFRAFAHNSAGLRAASNEKFFTPEYSSPIIKTKDPDDYYVGAYEAVSGGIISHTGGWPVTEWGLCFEEGEINPPQECPEYLKETGFEEGPFDFTMTIGEEPHEPLKPGRRYSVAAFARNDEGVRFGETEYFQTTREVPSVTIKPEAEMEIGGSWAKSGGEVTATGGADVTQRGVCWHPDGDPKLLLDPESSNNCTNNGSGEGPFDSEISELWANTFYNIRAYAINIKGAGWSEQMITFQTLSAEEPELTTQDPDEFGLTTARSGGYITDHGGAEIVERGICWNLEESGDNPNPEQPPTGEFEGCESETGFWSELPLSFIMEMENLRAGSYYYVQAYAKNTAELYGYGGSKTFKTDDPHPPEVSTDNVDVRTQEGGWVEVKGTLISHGGDPNIRMGICYSHINMFPNLNDSPDTTTCVDYTDYEYDPSDEDFEFVIEIPDGNLEIDPETGETYTYRVRAFARNTIGGEPYDRYGDIIPFKIGICYGWVAGVQENVDSEQNPRDQCLENWSCDGNCKRVGDPGYCNGAGSCVIDVSENIPSDYVCTGSGTLAYRSATYHCGTAKACSANNCTAYTYYRGCDGNGSCKTNNDNAHRVTTHCNAGQKCSAGSCVDGLLAQCKYCSGGSVVDANTKWGSGAYGCTAGWGNNMQRCCEGSCVKCSSTDADGNYGGRMLPWAGSCTYCSTWQSADYRICWRPAIGVTYASCDTVCANFGGCVGQNWNDTTNCAVCRSWYPDYDCSGIAENWSPSRRFTLGWGWRCRYREAGVSQSCSEEAYYTHYRFCICRH